MSEAGPEPVGVEPPRRHRWLRRELWFIVVGVLAVLATYLAMRHKPSTHVAPGVPYGTVPTPGPVVPAPRGAPPPA